MQARLVFRTGYLLALALLAVGAAAHAQPASLIQNGGFDRDTERWSFWFTPNQGIGKAFRVPREGGGALQVDVERCLRPSNIQIYQGPFTVRKGDRYLIRFEARAPRPGNLRIQLMLNNPPYSSLGLATEVPLTTEWRSYSLVATATADSDDARLDFFPNASLMLDSVSMTPAPGGDMPALRPAAAILGKGWNGDAKALLDNNTGSVIRSEVHPAQPLFVLLDLGELKTVQQVDVSCLDQNRHAFIAGIDVEVSEDNRRWAHWARGAKDGPSALSQARVATFSASSLAVRARYVRVRFSDVRVRAVVDGVRVIGGEGDSGLPASALPALSPVKDLAFLGWDYGRLGYAVTPGEKVALAWANHGSSPVDVPVSWRLESYAGAELARGNGRLRADAGARVELPISLPTKMAGGPVRLRCDFPGENGVEGEAFFFDYQVPTGNAALDLRVVALLDNNDPEGWMRMMAGPLGAHLLASSDWTEGTPCDAAVVMSEAWPETDARVTRLKSYLRAGGKALVFGKPAAALAEVVPVTVDARQPWAEKPMRLGALAAGALWRDFRPASGPRHYGVRVAAKPGSVVLARWEDGTPAVVEGSFGQGRVIYVGAGPGRVWQARPEMVGADELGLRLLYRLAGRESAIPAMLSRAGEIAAAREGQRRAVLARVFERLTIPRPKQYAVTSLENVGRFGWRIGEGGLAENLTDSGDVVCTAALGRSWAPVGLETLRGRSVAQNWISKTIAWSDGQRDVVRATVSVASPGILWEGRERQFGFAVPGVTHLAYPTAGGVRVVARGGEAVDPTAMTGNWLVLFSEDADTRDAPRLLVLTRRPEKVTLGETFTLSFGSEGFGALWTARLWGIRRLAPGEAGAWTKGLPAAAVEAAQRWSRAFLSFPVACDEVAWVEGKTVVVANRFRFRTFADAWKTVPQPLAPLPPVLSLARRDGVPAQVPQGVVDCQFATKYGPLEAVPGEGVLYRLPLPPHDHYGVIPVKGRMDLSDAIDHYAIDGTGSVTTASGGLVSSTPFVEDLRRYMSSGSFPPFAAPCIDLYKWWYCFPTVLGRPAYGATAREKADAYHREHYWQTLNFYPHKGFVQFRREPWTGVDYTVSFIWPVHVHDGVRYYVDQNESSAVLAYCLASYARYYGDWSTVASNWNLCRRLYEFQPKFHDWTWMTSSNTEYFSVAGIDMLNSEYPGSLAYADLARQVGDAQAETEALVLAAKSLVPAVARFAMPEYIRSITAEGDAWRRNRYYFSLHETGLEGTPNIEMRGGPESIMELAIGFLDTAKGTSPEITLAYKAWAGKHIEQYERDLVDEEKQRNLAVGWPHLMQRAFLRWPRAELLETARKFHARYPRKGWQSTMGPHNLAALCTADTPLFLADWAPAEYLSGSFDPATGEVSLRFRNRETEQYQVRLYSQRRPLRVRVNGSEVDPGPDTWQYDAGKGWLGITLRGQGENVLEITLGDAVAPLHPYFAPTVRK